MTKYNTELVSQLPPSTSLEENRILVARIMAGDKRAREEMIGGNTALVMTLVDNYVRQYPHLAYLRDDMTSAGFVGLVRAVGQLPEEYDPELGEPGGYIVPAVTREILQMIEAENMIRIPHTTQYENTANGKRIKPLTPCTATLETFTCDSEEALFEMRDLIQSCCRCPEERVFVEMREAGYSVKEIAEALKLSIPKTYRVKRELYARVLAKSGLKHIKKGE